MVNQQIREIDSELLAFYQVDMMFEVEAGFKRFSSVINIITAEEDFSACPQMNNTLPSAA